jgi:hypothetical protein
MVEVDTTYVVSDAFFDGSTYTYIAFGARGLTPAITGGTGVAFTEHVGGGVQNSSSYQITSSTPITSIALSTATQSAFNVHKGSLFWDGTWDTGPSFSIPAGESMAWGYGFTEDLGTSVWYANVDGVETDFSSNVRVHAWSAPIEPGATHTIVAAGYLSGGLGIQSAYWGYTADSVTCP